MGGGCSSHDFLRCTSLCHLRLLVCCASLHHGLHHRLYRRLHHRRHGALSRLSWFLIVCMLVYSLMSRNQRVPKEHGPKSQPNETLWKSEPCVYLSCRCRFLA